MKLLIERYRECPELAWGHYQVLETGEASVLALRSDIDDDTVITVHSLADTDVEAQLVLNDLDESVVLTDLLTPGESAVSDSGTITLTLGPTAPDGYVQGPDLYRGRERAPQLRGGEQIDRVRKPLRQHQAVRDHRGLCPVTCPLFA